MTIFAIVALTEPAETDRMVADAFRDGSFQLGPGHWLVYGTADAQSIAQKVGWGWTKEYAGRSGLVYALNGYYGIANPGTWDWLEANWNRANA